jgi:3-deoxy-D-manno-octulosonic acid hydroxylase-like protein
MIVELVPITDTSRELAAESYELLEAGNVLYFARSPIELPRQDIELLLSQRQAGSTYYKNIAYRPSEDRVTGLDKTGDRERMRQVLKRYCNETTCLLAKLLARYATGWRVDFTSFRPFEEEGRALALHARNDLLHVDAFPTRPTHGNRILRFFTNLNPTAPRVWMTGEAFPELAARYAVEGGITRLARRRAGTASQVTAKLAGAFGLRQFTASPYDTAMHRFHNFLKENAKFQGEAKKTRTEFPPGSSWIVFTDMVSHAVLSGQFALEQTFIIPYRAQHRPELAPVNILEKLAGRPLTWSA